MAAQQRFDPRAVRTELLKRGTSAGRIIPFAYRPFDVRWLYWEPTTKLLDEKRADAIEFSAPATIWLVGQRRPRRQELRVIGGLQTIEPDYAVAARWGIHGQGGVVMPGPGKMTLEAVSI